jgi:hypothetical protein
MNYLQNQVSPDAGHKPHDARAFGYVFRVLAGAGRIAKCGFATRRNGSPMSIWEAQS